MSYDNLINSNLGQYELRERLGKGGMGAVYRAYQANLNREVAVKVLSEDLADDPQFVERFKREAKTAAGLEHSYIVPVYDYGNVGDITYVVMRLLEGGSLADRLRNALKVGSSLPALHEVTKLLDHISGALDYAHRLGVIHRDIKPSNIMYDGEGNVFIVDFGIAKLVNANSQITTAGMMMGTPTYMAPEQWRTETVTPATDQYAVGVMIYQVLVGEPPFQTPVPFGLMNKHLNEYPTPPHTLRNDLSEAVSDVLSKAMAKQIKDRFSNMTEFAVAFREAVEHQRFASTHLPTPQAVQHRTPPVAPTVPQADQIRPSTPPPVPPPLQSHTPPQTPVQQLPWNMPPTPTPMTPPPRAKAQISPYIMGLVAVILAIVAIVIGILVLGGGDEDAQVSAVDRAERYLNAIVDENADEAKNNACPDIYDETDSIIASFNESGGAPPLESVACEQDGSRVNCSFVSEGNEQSTYFTVDSRNRICGGEVIDLVSSLNDTSSEESSSQLPTLAVLPTSHFSPTPTPTSRATIPFVVTATP